MLLARHRRPLRSIAALLALAATATIGTAAHASCRLLRFSFEPDCLKRDPGSGACRFDVDAPDYGSQIAVWLESADGTTFVDTITVTNGVALYGIGNRPGRWDFRSGPLFPYRRHEPVSSPESQFCRPMMKADIVDAITCASGSFRSAKGLLEPGEARTYYPPRGDIRLEQGLQSGDQQQRRQRVARWDTARAAVRALLRPIMSANRAASEALAAADE